MNTQTFNLSLPKDLVKIIDEQAKKDFSSRSDYIRKSLVAQLKKDGLATSNPEAFEVAKQVLQEYRQDFENLSKR